MSAARRLRGVPKRMRTMIKAHGDRWAFDASRGKLYVLSHDPYELREIRATDIGLTMSYGIRGDNQLERTTLVNSALVESPTARASVPTPEFYNREHLTLYLLDSRGAHDVGR
ncbi:MAG: hypothetical protein HC923_03440 [Myxococcales bacterium]|nr:hypothetical protein [Myxococcales bacterium]